MKFTTVNQLIYWFCVSLLIALLFGTSFGSFWEAWLVSLLFIPPALLIKFSWPKIVPLPKAKRVLRIFYLAVASLYSCYLSITLAYWYFLELRGGQMEEVFFNPILVWIILGFFVGLEGYLWAPQNTSVSESITIFSDRKKTNLLKKDILFIESRNEFTLVILSNGREIKNNVKISSWENQLPDFLRVHRSFLINPQEAVLNGNEIIIHSKWQIPVSRSFKKPVSDYFLNR
jgi:hypothetical protein